MYHTAQFSKLNKMLVFKTSVTPLSARVAWADLAFYAGVPFLPHWPACVLPEAACVAKQNDFPLTLEDPALVKERNTNSCAPLTDL